MDWNKSNRQLFNQIRGMNPWPVAHTFLKGDRFKIYEALPVEGQGNQGEILNWQERIDCRNGRRALSLNKCSLLVNLRWTLLPFLNGVRTYIDCRERFGD